MAVASPSEIHPLVIDDRKKTFHYQTCQELEKMYKDDILTDITLKLADGRNISCHRNILYAKSPFFKAMFQSGMQDSTSKEVTLDHLDPDCVMAIVDYMYSGYLEIEWGQVEQMLDAAGYLQIHPVIQHCDQYIMWKITPQNASHWFSVALARNLTSVLVRLETKFFQHICHSDDFKMLPLREVKRIIKNDCLVVPSEDVVLQACLEWTGYVDNGAKDPNRDLFSAVHLAVQNPPRKPRRCFTNSKKLLYNSGVLNVRTMNMYDIKEKTNISFDSGLPDRSFPIRGARLCELPFPGFLMTGGHEYDPDEDLSHPDIKTCLMFDGITHEWCNLPNMLKCRAYHTCVLLLNKVYVIGGVESDKDNVSMECLDPSLMQWEEKCTLNDSNCRSAVGYETSIFMVGEQNFWRYDTVTDSFEKLAQLIYNPEDSHTFQLHGKIFQAWIVENKVKVTCYDLESNTWSLFSDTEIQHQAFHVIFIDGELFCDRESGMATLKYDFTEKSWNMCAPDTVLPAWRQHYDDSDYIEISNLIRPITICDK